MPNGDDHDLLIQANQKLSDMWTYMHNDSKENKEAHKAINKKLDEQQQTFSNQQLENSKTFLHSKTFWKIFGFIIGPLVLASFAYTTGAAAYVIELVNNLSK